MGSSHVVLTRLFFFFWSTWHSCLDSKKRHQISVGTCASRRRGPRFDSGSVWLSLRSQVEGGPRLLRRDGRLPTLRRRERERVRWSGHGGSGGSRTSCVRGIRRWRRRGARFISFHAPQRTDKLGNGRQSASGHATTNTGVVAHDFSFDAAFLFGAFSFPPALGMRPPPPSTLPGPPP